MNQSPYLNGYSTSHQYNFMKSTTHLNAENQDTLKQVVKLSEQVDDLKQDVAYLRKLIMFLLFFALL